MLEFVEFEIVMHVHVFGFAGFAAGRISLRTRMEAVEIEAGGA